MNKLAEVWAGKIAEPEAFCDQCLAEMKRANERMEKDQVEIEQLKTQTRAIINSIRAVLGEQTR
jgi:predicted  nucleic acid-binding Zn-ribbon protein